MPGDWRLQHNTTEWKTVTVANGAQNSGAIDLGYACNYLAVDNIPAASDNAGYNIAVSHNGTTFTILRGWFLGTPATVNIPGGNSAVIPIQGFRYVEFQGDTGVESAERTWKTRGA